MKLGEPVTQSHAKFLSRTVVEGIYIGDGNGEGEGGAPGDTRALSC